MSKFQIFLLFCAIISNISSKEHYTEEDSTIKQIQIAEEFDVKTMKSDVLACVLYVNENCSKCKDAQKGYEEFAEDVKDIINTYIVDCDTMDDESLIDKCREEVRNQHPQISCYTPPTMKLNPYTGKPMKATEYMMSGSDIGEFAVKHMPNHGYKLETLKDLKKFTRDLTIPAKVIVYTNKTTTSSMFKGLTGIYKDRVKFSEVLNTKRDILKQEEIKTFPTIVLYYKKDKGSEIEKKIYEGKLNIDDIKEFIEPYALKEKANLDEDDDKKKEKSDDDSKEDSVITLTPQNYEKRILTEEKIVLIHIFKDNQAPSWGNIQQKFGKMIVYANLQITSESLEKFAKNTLKVKSYPTIKYLPVGTIKKKKSKQFFAPDITIKDLSAEIVETIEDNSVSVGSLSEFQMMMQGAITENKDCVLYMMTTNTVKPAFKYASHFTKYNDKLKFITFKNPPAQMLKELNMNLSDLPKLVTVLKPPADQPNHLDADGKVVGPNIKMAPFQGKLTFAELEPYLNSLIGEVEEEKNGQQKRKVRKAIQIETQEDYEKACVKKKSFCFLALLNAVKLFKRKINKMNNSKKNQTQLTN